jgi:hypothetical protein
MRLPMAGFRADSMTRSTLTRSSEIFAQVQKIEEVDISVESNEYIDITLLSLPSPNIGAKQAEPLDSITGFHFGLFVSDDFNYFLLSHNCLSKKMNGTLVTIMCC